MTIRDDRIREIQKYLGKRKLVWYGTRATDSRSLLQFPQFEEVFSIIAPLRSLSLQREVCLETLRQQRVDLDAYRLDLDTSEEAHTLRRAFFTSLGEPCVVVMYRADSFFTSLYYPRSEYVEYLGLFHERQAPFEHKPWVETELRKWKVPVVPWRYFGDDDRPLLEEMLDGGPIVVRSSRSDGGAGLALVRTPEELATRWPTHADRFVGAAPYLHPNIPLNVNACVFADGSVSVHPASLQLIGVTECTRRTFGYCGNDFARIGELDDEILDALEDVVRGGGRWLASMGYLGAFGVDALLCDGKVYLTEINPRFQGSSDLCAELDRDLDRSDMFVEHMAALIGLRPPPELRLRDLAHAQRPVAQVICHNTSSRSAYRTRNANHNGVDYLLLTDPEVGIDPEAILFRAVVEDKVTEDGSRLNDAVVAELRSFADCGFAPAPLMT